MAKWKSFKSNWRQGVVSLSTILYSLLSSGATQEDRKASCHD